MDNDNVKRDEIGSWSRNKLEMLGKYLAAYVNILSTETGKKFAREFHYIDAFAGAVEHIDKETREYVDGSPRVALQTNIPFHSYTFIEKDRNKVERALNPLRSEFPAQNIKIICGDCNETIKNDILPQFPDRIYQKPSKLGFIFLDPYGINLEWSTVEAIGKRGVFDVLINFSVMGVTRQASQRLPAKDVQDRITLCMGGDGWLEICYKEDPQCALPGLEVSSHVRMHNGVADKLAEYYKQRLASCFGHVTLPKMMRNSKGSAVYALIFASEAKTATKKMQAIFNK